MAKKSRTYRVVVKLHFDKPCYPKFALDAVRDNIHGTFLTSPFHTSPYDPSYPSEFKIDKSMRLAKDSG